MNRMHPTLLVGYGRHGLRVLQSFLAGAAARGLLEWETASGVGANERRLSTMSLYWVPDVLRREPPAVSGSVEADNFEMMQDLYAQIETVEAEEARLAAAVAERLEEGKARLFNQRRLLGGQRRITDGLDVIVIAQPADESVVGKLREILQPAMKQLSRDPGLTRAAQGQDVLNLIEIFDFEEYWSDAPRQMSARAAIVRSLETSAEAIRYGVPAAGRVYLFDGRTPLGNHDGETRRQEQALLLDLLLLEGLRSEPEFRTLYQRERDDVPAVCTIGVRAVEHSTGRLRRLAAAAFSRGWLEYLIGSAKGGTPAPSLDRIVEPFLRTGKSEAGEALELRLRDAIEDVGARLKAADPHGDDWPAEVARAAQAGCEDWRRLLSGSFTADRDQELNRRVKDLPQRLAEAVRESLEDRQNPVPLGAVVAAIDQVRERLRPLADPPAATAPQRGAPPDLTALHRSFRELAARQLQPAGFRNRWWPAFALVAALGFGPLLTEGIASIAGDDAWAPGWAQVLLGATLAAAIAWITGRFLFHPLIERSVARAMGFFTRPGTGRITAALRRYVDSTAVRGELEKLSAALGQELGRRVVAEVDSELDRLRARLAERKREIEWLNAQLRDYLNLHGVEADAGIAHFRPNRETNGVVRPIENQKDLDVICRAANEATFRDLQRQEHLFSNWRGVHCDTFLDPHRFLDRLLPHFPAPVWSNEGEAARRQADDLLKQLHALERFPVSFFWLESDGLPRQTSFCAVPENWPRLPGVSQHLHLTGYQARVHKLGQGERLYLIEARLGVPPDLMRSLS